MELFCQTRKTLTDYTMATKTPQALHNLSELGRITANLENLMSDSNEEAYKFPVESKNENITIQLKIVTK